LAIFAKLQFQWKCAPLFAVVDGDSARKAGNNVSRFRYKLKTASMQPNKSVQFRSPSAMPPSWLGRYEIQPFGGLCIVKLARQ
jgi:hypothetical protein